MSLSGIQEMSIKSDAISGIFQKKKKTHQHRIYILQTALGVDAATDPKRYDRWCCPSKFVD